MINLRKLLMYATVTAAALPALAQSKFDEKFVSYPVNPISDEVIATPEMTVFRLWSPAAKEVKLHLYKTGTEGAPLLTIDMAKDEPSGTWGALVKRNLEGLYYTFQVNDGKQLLAETPGIWPKMVGLNGERAYIGNLDSTDPEGWADDKGPAVENFSDVIIYEMHHRDMSMHPSSGVKNKGKFLALTEEGTVNNYGDKTGLDHLKELGVTHVHILPSYDYNSVDESKPNTPQYNWGYDPLNYNAPEGSYSTDAAAPETRVREMKEMIKSLHDAGIGVIMDVVYNHTAENDNSNFELTAPGYFHRHWDDGRYSDASGCGNETASERRQMSDYIVNSVKYWANEYHIDGFRFDLMAIHDTETMNRVARELKAVNPSIFVYGEGWTAGDSPLAPERRALKENVSKMTDIAVFSDDIRDAIKGHYSNAEDRGFATGKPGVEETVKIGIVASTAHPQVDYSKGANSKFAYAQSPEMIVNYVSCHDDLMLTDKLRKSMPNASDDERKEAAKLAQTIVFTSQGTPFLWSGEEIFRDKKGVHNSYKSPDTVNAINWDLKHENADQFEYYKELIALRKAHPAFRMNSAEEIARNLVFDAIDSEKMPNLISYSLKNHANGDEWEEIKLVFNGSDKERRVRVDEADWTVVAQNGKLKADGLGKSKGGVMTLAPYSALIIAK